MRDLLFAFDFQVTHLPITHLLNQKAASSAAFSTPD
jgi:hypothetical protein